MSSGVLLPAQTLLDLCADELNSAKQWAGNIPLASLRVCVISQAQVYSAIEDSPSVSVRKAFTVALDSLFTDIEAASGLILPIDARVARIWQDLIAEPQLAGTEQMSRLVYATAIHHNCSIAEESQPAHDFLRSMGVEVVVI